MVTYTLHFHSDAHINHKTVTELMGKKNIYIYSSLANYMHTLYRIGKFNRILIIVLGILFISLVHIMAMDTFACDNGYWDFHDQGVLNVVSF